MSAVAETHPTHRHVPDLQPFRRDPIMRFFLRQPAWLTPLAFIGLYALLALCAWLDGTLVRIDSPAGRYPSNALIVPFIEEGFGPIFVMLFYPALVLYARILDRRIDETFLGLYRRGILTEDRQPHADTVRRCQKRFDSRWAWLLSLSFCAWFVALWVAARLGWLDDSLGIVVHVAARESQFGFAWILLFSLLGPHLFMSVVWRIVVCAHLLNRTFLDSGSVRLQPLHPDNCCGLRFIGDFTLLMSGFVAFFPLFLALLAWFYPRFLEDSLTEYVLIYAGAVVYVILATITFVFPTYSAHRLMFQERETALDLLNRHFFELYEQVFSNLEKATRVRKDQLESRIRLLNNIREYYREVRSRAIWPFNLRVVSEFAGIVGAPLLLMFIERLRP